MVNLRERGGYSESQLTMIKWDTLTSLLKDYKLDELLDTLERRASAAKPEQMK